MFMSILRHSSGLNGCRQQCSGRWLFIWCGMGRVALCLTFEPTTCLRREPGHPPHPLSPVHVLFHPVSRSSTRPHSPSPSSGPTKCHLRSAMVVRLHVWPECLLSALRTWPQADPNKTYTAKHTIMTPKVGVTPDGTLSLCCSEMRGHREATIITRSPPRHSRHVTRHTVTSQ